MPNDFLRRLPARLFRLVRRCFRNLYVPVARRFLLSKISDDDSRLIVFLTPGSDKRTGGVLSIAALYRESVPLREIHGATVLLCAVPGDPPYLKYSWFHNNNFIHDLSAVLRRFRRLESLLIHVPEYAVNQLVGWLEARHPAPALSRGSMRFNILLQNIDHMNDQNIAGLLKHGPVTCTTAHEAYTNPATRRRLGIPLHRLSVFIGPELYSRVEYERKEPILVVSNDSHPLKEPILRSLKKSLPGLRVCVVQNLSFDKYKDLIRRAKWALTFGEGMDGYFCEPVFSGSVSFAVFNNRFFTPEFESLDTVYPSWEALEHNLVSDLQRLDDPVRFRECWRKSFDLLAALYNTGTFRENLRKYYLGQYSFP